MTLAFAIIYALIIFPAILDTVGPQGHFGDLHHLIVKPIFRAVKRVWLRIRGRKLVEELKEEKGSEQVVKE